MHSRQQLVFDLRGLGVSHGDVIMAHASVRRVGEIAGGPDEIHFALSQLLGDSGLLMMYAGCPAYVDDVGRGCLTSEEEAEVLEKLPAFDAETARSARDHGILVEFFRTSPNTRVNHHPARFVARGGRTDELFATQPWDFGYGASSPLERLMQLDGKILLLGSDHDAVTFLHYVEHVADLPGRRIARYQVPVLDNGVRVWRDMQEVDTSGNGAHPNWPDRFFARIVDAYLTSTNNRGGVVGSATSYLMSARNLCAFAQPIMERVARQGAENAGIP